MTSSQQPTSSRPEPSASKTGGRLAGPPNPTAPPPDLEDFFRSDMETYSALEIAAPDGSAVDLGEEKVARRESSYQIELLKLFCERGRLVALMGVLLVPVYAGFYWYLSPDAERALFPVQGMQFAVLIAIYFLFHQVRVMRWARLLTLTGYVFFCMGAAAVMALASYNQFSDESGALRAVQFAILASYGQIMLSILLLPYSLWESLLVAVLVVSSLLWSVMWSAATWTEPIYLAQFFTLGITMLLVMCIAHFQNVLRRRVFDAAFDLSDSAAQLQRLSLTDAVTQGNNRRYLENVLNSELLRAARFSRTLSVMMFDLDNFKSVNDTKGHNIGDEVLREIWHATSATVREVDTVARYGGDEFVVVLPETGCEDAQALAERLQENTRGFLIDRFGVDSIEAHVTLSIGLYTLSPSENITFEYVIEQADEKLYQAKRQGKNRVAA